MHKASKKGSPTRTNDALMYCKQLFRHAVKLDLIQSNPALPFTTDDEGGVEKSRTRILSIEEVEAVLKTLREISNQFARENYLAVVLLLCLGVRKGELIAAQWSEFNLTDKLWHMPFKGLASSYGYKSAATSEIIINRDTYLPFLSGLALREIFNNVEADKDLKSDSSASDFVRLIWAYLISLYICSESSSGNHLGVIAFDEPGQHSMAPTRVNAMLKSLNELGGLQSIIAASFDEDEHVFEEQTRDADFHLVQINSKLLQVRET